MVNKKGIVGGKLLLETGETKGIVGGAIVLETSPVAGTPRTVIVNGQIYEETGERTVIVGGQIFDEKVPAAAVDPDPSFTASGTLASGGVTTSGTATRILTSIGTLSAQAANTSGTATLESTEPLLNKHISALHFKKPWEPTAMGT